MNGHLPDFNTLRELAEKNPEALEELRQREVQALIEQAPEQMRRRLEGIQFQIDAKRQIASNPMDACIAVSSMMHESFNDLRMALNNCMEGSGDELFAVSGDIDTESATILNFQVPAAAN